MSAAVEPSERPAAHAAEVGSQQPRKVGQSLTARPTQKRPVCLLHLGRLPCSVRANLTELPACGNFLFTRLAGQVNEAGLGILSLEVLLHILQGVWEFRSMIRRERSQGLVCHGRTRPLSGATTSHKGEATPTEMLAFMMAVPASLRVEGAIFANLPKTNEKVRTHGMSATVAFWTPVRRMAIGCA